MTQEQIEKKAEEYVNSYAKHELSADDEHNIHRAYVKAYKQALEDTKPAPKLPLSELANDSEMCQQIAEILVIDRPFHFADIEYGISIWSVNREELVIHYDGKMSFSEYGQKFSIPKALQIAALILSKYEPVK